MAELPQRKSLRRFDWDYSSPGAYFITITTRFGRDYFGWNDGGRLTLSAAGRMVAATWREIPARFPGARLDSFIVMPNHFHCILWIDPGPCELRPSIARMIMAFKSLTTVAYIHGVHECGWPPFVGRLWHRNYHDRIIRSQEALERIRFYVEANPQIHARRLSRS
jgi:putative transposase